MNESWYRHIAALRAHLALSPEAGRVRDLGVVGEALDPDVVEAVLEEAARFSADVLVPFDKTSDAEGCSVEDERVRLASGHAEAWAQCCEGGWVAVDAPEAYGGQALPLCLASAVQELFDRGSVSFGMLPGAIRGAIKLLKAHAAPEVAEAWIPKLASGKWGATICISEAEAGSDVGRIRAKAAQDKAGVWRLTGEKMWISYGDHPLTERIGHLTLARIEGDAAGTRGLSLFLVPNVLDNGLCNNVHVRGIEHKMGLHGSPTCAMGFEGAQAVLIGEQGRGLPQLFSMIIAMRLNVCCQGLGFAEDSYETAFDYALERRQGGRPDAPPVPIIEHADVRANLLSMASEIETLRGLNIAASALADISEFDQDIDERKKATALLGFLLPILKNAGAEAAFEISAKAILVLGGAGFTKDWPIERHLRDSRVLAIFEGTTGIQALDLVKRQLTGARVGLLEFLRCARDECAASKEPLAQCAETLFNALESASIWLSDPAREPLEVEAAATPTLRLATMAAQSWIALRLSSQEGEQDAAAKRLTISGRYWLKELEGQATRLLQAIYFAADKQSLWST